jgi:hypothetical protein
MEGLGLPRFDQQKYLNLFGKGPLPANGSLPWAFTDSEDVFNKHWRDPETKKVLVECGWHRDSIRYRSNDHGFRMDKDMGNVSPGGNVYLGCSITLGVGINIEDTWAWKLNQRIGGDFINLASPGTGFDTQYRMLRTWAGVLKPARVYTIGGFMGRREVIDERNSAIKLGHWVTGHNLKLYKGLASDGEIMIAAMRALDGMKAICLEHAIELRVPTADFFERTRHSFSPDFTARDLMHRNGDWHDRIAYSGDDFWNRLV